MDSSVRRLHRAIAIILGLGSLLVMWNSHTMIGIWFFGVIGVICSAYYAYLVMRYDLMDYK